MANTNFKIFDENKTNILSDSEYESNVQRQNGVQSGIASSKLQNKFQLQASMMIKAIADLVVSKGFNAMDSDNYSTFANNIANTLASVTFGSTDPTSSTYGYVGQLLLVTTPQSDFYKLWVCVAVNGNTYTWERVNYKSGTDGTLGTITEIIMNGVSKGTSGSVNLGNVVTDVSNLAPKASPAFTGTPTAPTPATTVNNTQIATTAFVHKAVSGYGPQWHEITNLSYSNAQVTALLLNNAQFGGSDYNNAYPMQYVKLNYFDIDSQVGGIENVKAFRFRMDNLRFSAGYIGTPYNSQSSSFRSQIDIYFSPFSWNSYYESVRLNPSNGFVRMESTYLNFGSYESAFRAYSSFGHPVLQAHTNTLNNVTLALNSLYTRNDEYNYITWTQYLNFISWENSREGKTYHTSKGAYFISPRAINESASFSFPSNGSINFFIVPYLSQSYQMIPGQMNNVRINGRFVFEALY